MNAENEYPKTLLEAVRYFSDANVATEFFAKMRWPDGVRCPHCGSADVAYLKNQRRWQCHEKHPRRQFSAKVGTIFEESPLGLDKWFVAVWCITNAKNGISSCELARALGVTQKSAWFMLHRVRHAMHCGSFEKFAGVVESDETYVGGAASNMHLSRRKAKIQGRGGVGNAKRTTLVPEVRQNVADGSTVYTDALASYNYLSAYFIHESVDHAKEYVRGAVHTNGMENFWSLFKRAINGTYVSVDAPHLQRYVDEEVFRFNERKLNDGERFFTVMPGTIGRRITYNELIGKNELENLPASDEAGNGDLPN
jgi:transposase-like protein